MEKRKAARWEFRLSKREVNEAIVKSLAHFTDGAPLPMGHMFDCSEDESVVDYAGVSISLSETFVNEALERAVRKIPSGKGYVYAVPEHAKVTSVTHFRASDGRYAGAFVVAELETSEDKNGTE